MERLFHDPATLGTDGAMLWLCLRARAVHGSGMSCLSWDAQLGACFGADMVQREMLYFFPAADGEGSFV